jgi:hypothetical protein
VGLDHEHTRYYSARPRRVPPEFCTDELLEECSLLAALTLYRIISQADDQGRLPGSPKYVRALCFGMRPKVSEAAVAKAIGELVAARFLIRYESRGRMLLQVDRWLDLQGKWGRHSYASRHPAPAGWTSDWVSAKSEPDASELHADDEQPASKVHTPLSIASTVSATTAVSPSFSSSLPTTGRVNPPPRNGGWGSAGDVLRNVTEGARAHDDRPAARLEPPRRSQR